MKSLDEHLRDASQAWTQEATPTLVTSADVIAKTLRPRSWMFPWGLGTLGLGVVAAVTLYTSQMGTDKSGTDKSGTTQSVMSQTSKSQTEPPLTEPSQISMSQSDMSQTSMSQTSPSPSLKSRASTPNTRLRVEGQTDGFTTEYERVLGQAMSLEAADPLKAVNEYMGLVRLCERREKYAHAVSALERAAILADQIGDANLKSSVDTKLSEIKGMLAP
ncbi:MAG: hypothetical protein EHM43_09815 [Ignavibacteriae bacterium]|nr:MAG: hypothetical protein EHM43_09815 [Ignavibacteriota bacterium]